MNSICGDNRFEIIGKAKKDLHCLGDAWAGKGAAMKSFVSAFRWTAKLGNGKAKAVRLRDGMAFICGGTAFLTLLGTGEDIQCRGTVEFSVAEASLR